MDVVLLTLAASATALATGLGAVPVFFMGARAEVLRPILLGTAIGAMTVASIVGLLRPALQEGSAGRGDCRVRRRRAPTPGCGRAPEESGRTCRQAAWLERPALGPRLRGPPRSQPAGGASDRHRLRVRPRRPEPLRDPRDRPPEHSRGDERRDSDGRGRVRPVESVLGGSADERSAARWCRRRVPRRRARHGPAPCLLRLRGGSDARARRSRARPRGLRAKEHRSERQPARLSERARCSHSPWLSASRAFPCGVRKSRNRSTVGPRWPGSRR